MDFAFWGSGYTLGYFILDANSIFDKKVLAGIFLIAGYVLQVLFLEIYLGYTEAICEDDFEEAEKLFWKNLEYRVLYLGVLLWVFQTFYGMYTIEQEMIVGVPEWEAFLLILAINILRSMVRNYAKIKLTELEE
ncbi:hypothetical protein ACFL35_07020 [Candidatus Riflebacteria bacterium]